ncbi:MAG: RnfH family protein [Betaproteobacteria bacterium]|nr:RnfH family protein [Betaproteobacteria bacterium]MDE1990014.1 RnfH family protein [Betaproteobacteria bacterium]
MQVTVAYALPERQTLLTLEVEVGCTLEAALRRSGLLERHPEIDLARQAVGICGRVRALSTVLKAGDRVEVYRPRLADPKALRRSRAERS